MPPPDSELAQQATRDPYLLDFLAVREPLLERDLEDALTADLQRFLLELGTGFAYCGRQVPIRVEGREYALDLLFFNWRLNRFVAVELMVTEFDPGHAGRLGFYVTWIDDNLRLDHHNPTLGILVCATKTNSVVRYTLDSLRTPMAVAAFTTLPAELQAALPPAEALQELVAETLRHESPGGEVPR